MKITGKNIALIFFIVLIVGCQKEDTAVILPAPGDMSNSIATMGPNYLNQVYFDFGTGKQHTVDYRIYDLAFESSANGFRIYLNTGKLMFVCHTGETNFNAADTSGKQWRTDSNQLDDDSTAIGDWKSNGEVIVIDRGRAENYGVERWRKLKVISVDANSYNIEYQTYNSSVIHQFQLIKDPDYSLVYFSFDNDGQQVSVSPKKDSWDIVFTKFTHTYYDEPITSPFKYYLVTGAILNKWNNELNTSVKKDSTIGYKPFVDVIASDINSYPLSAGATIIGFDWKYFDFNLGYIIYPDRFYLLKDELGFYYKIRFLDFYDSTGNKGSATFEYQRL